MLLIALLLAPPLQRYGGYTLPDVLAERFGGGDARIVGIVAILATSLPLLVAALWVAGLVTAQAVGIGLGSGVFIVGAVLVIATLPGGMRSLSLLQVGLGVVLILLVAIAAIGLGVVASPHDAGSVAPLVEVRSPRDWDKATALAITLALGTAVLPHLLMRSICVNSAQAARFSFAWALLFLVPLSFAPRAFRAGLSFGGRGGTVFAIGPARGARRGRLARRKPRRGVRSRPSPSPIFSPTTSTIRASIRVRRPSAVLSRHGPALRS